MKLVEKEDDQMFSLPGTSSAFNERQRSVFDMLDKAEKEKPQNRYSTEEFLRSETKIGRTVSSGCRKDFKQFVGKESIFKRPEVQPKKAWKRRMPDFQKNPHKWTKYSLEDVSLDQMTDKSNSATAIAFMKELSTRNSDSEMEVEENHPTITPSAPEKIIFNKHINLLSEASKSKEGGDSIEQVEKPTMVSGKYVMPEYTVGQKVKPKKVGKKTTENVKSQIKLDHLLEEDED